MMDTRQRPVAESPERYASKGKSRSLLPVEPNHLFESEAILPGLLDPPVFHQVDSPGDAFANQACDEVPLA